MDMIKTESEFDPLAVESCDISSIEQGNASLAEENLLIPHDFHAAVESTDLSYSPNCELKTEGTTEAIAFPVVKCESEQETFGMVPEEEEIKLEVTKSVMNTKIHEVLQVKDTVSESVLLSENASCGRVLHPQIHEQFLITRSDLQSETHNHTGTFASTRNASSKLSPILDNINSQPFTPSDSIAFKCFICGMCFSDKHNFNNHTRKHAAENLALLNIRGKTLVDHKNTDKTFKCDICGKYFSGSASLSIHVRKHSDRKPYQCDICGKCLSEPAKLRNHIRIHTGEKPFKCVTCGKCFLKSESLALHMRRHMGVKPYKCNDCGKCFSSSSYLGVHKRMHTGEKPYKCDICGKCFPVCHSLTLHLRSHAGDKRYKCDGCGNYFARAGSRNTHARLYCRGNHQDN